MKRNLFLGLFLLFITSCELEEPHCYILGKSKIVAYGMANERQEIWGNRKKFSFYDKKSNVFFATYSEVEPTCVPCDSSFLGINLQTKDSVKVGQPNVKIQIGTSNEVK